jgi:ABC-2 type transport system permease protein
MGFADIIFATTAFTLAYTNLNLNWSPAKWGFFGLALAASLVIETCISWIIGAISFWTGRSRALFFIQMRFSLLSQQYPLDIFGHWYRVFVTGFLPVAFMNYYPLTILMDKKNALDVPLLGFLSPAVALILLMITLTVWHKGLASYTSSGN